VINNYLKFIFRNIRRNKVYSSINIVGLAVGMTCTIFIILWVRDELSFDRYHANANQIYRVTYKTDLPNYHAHFARCPYGWVNALPEEFPEILDLVRFSHQLKIAIQYKEKKFNESRFFSADPNVFQVFSFPLLQGDPKNALRNPNSIIISESMANKYFAEEDPLGKILETRSQRGEEAKYYTITGIFKDFPSRSHFRADFLASYDEPRIALKDIWSYVYILLKRNADPDLLEQKFPEFITKYADSERARYNSLHLQPLTDIHLHSNLDREIEPNGNFSYIIIFTIVAILILLIACINFINLSTARAGKRALEIGIRKTAGATRSQLIRYILTESVIYCYFALLLTFLLVMAFLSTYNDVSGKTFSFEEIAEWKFLLVVIIFPIAVGVLSGTYPTFFLSAVKPISILKGRINGIYISRPLNKRTKFALRNILVLAQFSISIILMVCFAFTYLQHNFLIKNRLGNQRAQVIAIPNTADPIKKKYRLFKNELSGHSGIIDVCASMEEPSKEVLDAFPFTAEGITLQEENTIIYPLPVDNNFLDFFGLDLIAGQDFQPSSGESPREEYILNETAVKMIGWNSAGEAIGKNLKLTPHYARFEGGPIVGVVGDFNFSSLKKQIKPLVLFQRPIWYFCFLIKVEPDKVHSALAFIENKWEQLFPEYPFEFYFVDNLFAKLYRAEKQQEKIIGVFALLSIIITCLGLFGLVAYTLERRTKEIGIRKVLGASGFRLFILLSKDLSKWALIANIISWPIAWLAMKSWLQNFAYKVDMSIWIFLIAGCSVLIISILTVSIQVTKSILTNPVNALRYE
jgi:putative ABC transport system permease protein